MDKDKKLFPQRLWDLVHDERYNHFLRWSEDGQRVYLSRNDFEEQYLRTPLNQFHTQKAISFVRQMNMYGFKKVDDCHYENDNFKRGCHHLIRHMVRRNSNRPQATGGHSGSGATITLSASLSDHQGPMIRLINDGGGGGDGSGAYMNVSCSSGSSSSGASTGGRNSSFHSRPLPTPGNNVTTMMLASAARVPHEGLLSVPNFNQDGEPGSHGMSIGGDRMVDVEGQAATANNNLRALYEQLVSLNQINHTAHHLHSHHHQHQQHRQQQHHHVHHQAQQHHQQHRQQQQQPHHRHHYQHHQQQQQQQREGSSMIQQLVRSSTQLNDLISRQQVTSGAVGHTTSTTTTTRTSAATTAALGHSLMPGIAQSSLASSLYNRLAVPELTTRHEVAECRVPQSSCFPLTAETTATNCDQIDIGEAVRSMLAAQSLVEAANREQAAAAAAAATAAAATEAASAVATTRAGDPMLSMTLSDQTRTLATAQQILQQTLIGSLMQLRLAQLPQVENLATSHTGLLGTGLGPTMPRNSNLHLQQNQNQNHLTDNFFMGQNYQLGMGRQASTAANFDVCMMNVSDELPGSGDPLSLLEPVASCSSFNSSSTKTTSSRSSTSQNIYLTDEILRRNSDQYPLRSRTGGGGFGLVARCSPLSAGASTMRINTRDCDLERTHTLTAGDDEDDDGGDSEGASGHNLLRDHAKFLFVSEASSEGVGHNSGGGGGGGGEPGARHLSVAHCMSGRQIDGALMNLSCGKRENRSV